MLKLLILIITYISYTAISFAADAATENTGYQSVVGSKHDLSGNPSMKANIKTCAYCHVMDDESQEVRAALNRSSPVSTFTSYRSNNPNEETGALAAVSSHCMSCHDGETPFDAIGGGRGTQNNNMNALYPDSTAIIGRNLDTHHPVGVVNPGGLYFKASPVLAQSGLPLYDNKVECTTCHDVHGEAGAGKFLRSRNENSSLCLECHNK